MLRPTKHSHPDQTVIALSLILLQRLKKRRSESYDDLLAFSRKSVIGANYLFAPALNFLFLMGKVIYRRKTDSFEFVEQA